MGFDVAFGEVEDGVCFDRPFGDSEGVFYHPHSGVLLDNFLGRKVSIDDITLKN